MYSPDACQYDMSCSVITSDDDDMNNMKSIFKSALIICKNIADFREEKTENVIPVSSNTNDALDVFCIF